ncbi:MAG TPA: class I SAM-dependent methyltransferase [Verrucomicrobiae bacterium]|jgi:SAM-dependent methyltransferase
MNVKHVPYQIDERRDRYHFYENHWKRVALGLLLRHLKEPAGKTLLDYGCGRGEALALTKAAGLIPTGTDADPECVRLASALGPAKLLEVEHPLQQFGERSFDVVMCFHVLEHVDNPKAVLTALGRIAREYVVLAVPNTRYLHRLFHRNISLAHVNEGHLQAWDHWHFRNLAERFCGLDLVEWGFDATILPFVSNATEKVFGQRAAIWLETGLFRRLFPFHGISVLGVFRPRR